MQTYIAFLRGINVSGQKKIKMAEFKTHLEKLPINNVQTYIQSGNVVFSSSSKETAKLSKLLTGLIKNKYGFDVPVLVKSEEDLNDIFEGNTFLPEKEKEFNYLLVTMLEKVPDISLVESLNNYTSFGEEIKYSGKELYLYFPNGYGRSKLSNNFIEKKLKVQATTRNWKTISKMVELANEIHN